MRLGIYGGTFDPVHYAHLLAAERCREQCRLDELWFIPAAVPPHKPARSISPGEARAEMLEVAIAGHPHFKVDRRDLERAGLSYTVDTLAEIRAEDPMRELFLLLGADSVADFGTWREPERILGLATLMAVNRGRERADMRGFEERFGAAAREGVLQVEMPAVDLAATDLRERVRDGRSIRYMTPRGVEAYIVQHGLYR
jgi:nicotinate-nucleotide adenylyltransferase